MIRLLTLVAAAALTFSLSAAEDKPKIKQVPPQMTSPSSGAEMFKAYCAVCHGANAKGNGPAAPALKKQPADLTRLSADNKGKFPSLQVFNSITGDNMMPSHGSVDMPIWGDVFRTMSRDEGARQMRLHNLTKYIESIQGK
jgi:mono/diheme cytochrome c family protein